MMAWISIMNSSSLWERNNRDGTCEIEGDRCQLH